LRRFERLIDGAERVVIGAVRIGAPPIAAAWAISTLALALPLVVAGIATAAALNRALAAHDRRCSR
jgi:hypothetical protein